jgi:2'-5' RNA ligase
MRLFLAVFPPPDIQAAAYARIEALRAPGARVSWTRRENLHYTLRFLGEVGEDGARRAAEAAAEAASDHRAFAAELGALGAFPNPRRARVLWLGLTRGGEPLVALAASLDRALARRGFPPEGRAFEPHLTLGRVREPQEDWSTRLAAAAATVAAEPATARGFRVDRISVVESQLDPKGSRYTVRAEAALAE